IGQLDPAGTEELAAQLAQLFSFRIREPLLSLGPQLARTRSSLFVVTGLAGLARQDGPGLDAHAFDVARLDPFPGASAHESVRTYRAHIGGVRLRLWAVECRRNRSSCAGEHSAACPSGRGR